MESSKDRSHRPWLLPVAIILVTAVVGISYSVNRGLKAEVGKPAPQFALVDMAGSSVELSDFEGDVVFLNFWTTWCDACRDEMPALVAFHEAYGDRVVQIGVNVREPVDKITRFMDGYGAKYDVLRDTDGKVAERYHVRGYPETWVIAADGTAVAHWVGPMTLEQMVGLYEQARDSVE